MPTEQETPIHDKYEAWEKEFGNLLALKIEDDFGKEQLLVFRRPDRLEIKAFLDAIKSTDEVTSMDTLAQNCLLNKEQLDFIKTSTAIFDLQEELQWLVERKKVVLKKP